MRKLFDFINNKPILKRLYIMLTYGIDTSDLRFLLPHLNEFEIYGDTLTTENTVMFRKRVIDDMQSKEYSPRNIQQMMNFLTIYGATSVSMQKESVPDEDINVEFAARFYDYTRDCNDKAKQTLCSKILSKELLKPHSYFLRTLDVFFQADTFEIDWFFELTKYVFDQACVPEFILPNNKFYPFNQFQTLIDAGFINPLTGNISFKETSVMHFPTVEVKIEVLNPSFGFGIYTLTDAGSQLCDLRPEETPIEYLNKFRENLERNNFAKVVSID